MRKIDRELSVGDPVVSVRWLTGPIADEWDDPAHIAPDTPGYVTRVREYPATFPYAVLFRDDIEMDVYDKDIRPAEPSTKDTPCTVLTRRPA